MEIEGLDDIIKRLEAIKEKKQVKINQFVAQEADILKGIVMEKTPVGDYSNVQEGYEKTGGDLRGAWKRTRAAQGRVEVYNNSEYAMHVEYGHRQTPGRYVPAIGARLKNDFVKGEKMLHRAVLEYGKTFPEHAEQVVKNILNDTD